MLTSDFKINYIFSCASTRAGDRRRGGAGIGRSRGGQWRTRSSTQCPDRVEISRGVFMPFVRGLLS